MLKSATGIQSFRAGKRAHSDLIALSELHVTAQLLKSLVSELVSRVNDPPVCLHENRGSQVVLWMPPVRGAGGLAAGA